MKSFHRVALVCALPAIILLSLYANEVQTKSVYASTNANAAIIGGTGTQQDPFLNIYLGVKNLTHGDELVLLSGYTRWGNELNAGSMTKVSFIGINNLTVRPEIPGGTVIGFSTGLEFTSCNNLTVRDLVFVDPQIPQYVTKGPALALQQGSTSRFINITCHNATSCIQAFNTPYMYIENSLVVGSYNGITVTNSTVVVFRSNFTNMYSYNRYYGPWMTRAWGGIYGEKSAIIFSNFNTFRDSPNALILGDITTKMNINGNSFINCGNATRFAFECRPGMENAFLNFTNSGFCSTQNHGRTHNCSQIPPMDETAYDFCGVCGGNNAARNCLGECWIGDHDCPTKKTWYVSPNANSSASGLTKENPTDPDSAVSRATFGDTIIFQRGLYLKAVILSGQDKALHFRTENNFPEHDGVVFDCSEQNTTATSGTRLAFGFNTKPSWDTLIEGMTFRNCETAVQASVVNVRNIIVENTYTTARGRVPVYAWFANQGAGILFADNLRMRNITQLSISPSGAFGTYPAAQGLGFWIKNSIIETVRAGHGISVGTATPAESEIYIKDTIFIDMNLQKGNTISGGIIGSDEPVNSNQFIKLDNVSFNNPINYAATTPSNISVVFGCSYGNVPKVAINNVRYCGFLNETNTCSSVVGKLVKTNTADDCGVCGGSGNSRDCSGECFGRRVNDDFGGCCYAPAKDCKGRCNGTAVVDSNGICCAAEERDCFGVCFGSGRRDPTGACCAQLCDGICLPPGKACNCDDAPCLNGGVCFQGSCNCLNTTGWTGDRCATPICQLECLNGGVCDGPNHCNCAGTGHSGARCGYTSCGSNNGTNVGCDNGGACQVTESVNADTNVTTTTFSCNCNTTQPGGYTGNVCRGFTCTNGCAHGQCIGPDTCRCERLWTGALCDIPIVLPYNLVAGLSDDAILPAFSAATSSVVIPIASFVFFTLALFL